MIHVDIDNNHSGWFWAAEGDKYYIESPYFKKPEEAMDDWLRYCKEHNFIVWEWTERVKENDGQGI